MQGEAWEKWAGVPLPCSMNRPPRQRPPGWWWRRIIQGDNPSDRLLLPQLALELTLLPHIWETIDAAGGGG